MTRKPPSQFQQYDGSQYDGGEGGDSSGTRPSQIDFQALYKEAQYLSAGRSWDDYAPAYRYGADSQRLHAGKRFEDVEAELSRNWANVRDVSRLGWVEARGAVEDAWHAAAAAVLQGSDDDSGQQSG